tara:strand:- start:1160 stop:2491 length:1332 start_codon:yes stop_codon:yes gene_type:complete
MSAIIRHLQSTGIDIPACNEARESWVFREHINKRDKVFFQRLVRHHLWLSFEYNVRCTQLAHNLVHRDSDVRPVLQIKDALAMAELLERLYRDYLSIPSEVMRLQREQAFYRQLLRHEGYSFPPHSLDELGDYGISATIQRLTGELHAPRVLAVRSRRFLVATLPVIDSFPWYTQMVKNMDTLVSQPFTHLGWLFFVPRLSANLFLTAKHVLPGAWLSKDAAALDWQTRLYAQMQRRWFELANDSAWLLVGLTNAFVCTGSLASCGIYITLCLQAYDVLAASFKGYYELQKLHQLQDEYNGLLKGTDLSDEERRDIQSYQKHLTEQIHYEQRKSYWRVVNCTMILLSVALALPVLTFNPAFAIAGGALAVFASIASWKVNQWMEDMKPADKIQDVMLSDVSDVSSSSIRTLGFFASPDKSDKSDKSQDTIGEPGSPPALTQNP